MTVISTEYHRYINSPEWREKRAERLFLDDRRCTRCEAAEQLEVHHVSYERLGNERMDDLRTLCGPCHAREHGRDPELAGSYPLRAAQKRAFDRENLEYAQLRILNRARREQGLPIINPWQREDELHRDDDWWEPWAEEDLVA